MHPSSQCLEVAFMHDNLASEMRFYYNLQTLLLCLNSIITTWFVFSKRKIFIHVWANFETVVFPPLTWMYVFILCCYIIQFNHLRNIHILPNSSHSNGSEIIPCSQIFMFFRFKDKKRKFTWCARLWITSILRASL